MKEIQLTQGKVANIDNEDYEYFNKWKWSYGSNGYARREVAGKYVYMHSLIAKTPKGMLTDHINGDKLDNRKSNLRICTASQNQQNKGNPVNNTSGAKGVDWDNKNKRWRARIRVQGKYIYLGLHKLINSAIVAYNDAAKKYHGDFAKLNELLPEETEPDR